MAIKKIRYFPAFILLIIICGCSQSLALKVETEVPVPLVSKIPVSIGVYYDNTFRTHVYEENSADRQNWAIESGPSQVALFNQVLPSMFRDVRQLSSLPEAGISSGLNAVLVPSIEDMQFSLPRETRLDMYEVWIKYKIRLLETNGNLITEWPLTAYGRTTTDSVKSRKKGLYGAMELALRDAGAKMVIGFPQAMGVKQWLAANVEE